MLLLAVSFSSPRDRSGVDPNVLLAGSCVPCGFLHVCNMFFYLIYLLYVNIKIFVCFLVGLCVVSILMVYFARRTSLCCNFNWLSRFCFHICVFFCSPGSLLRWSQLMPVARVSNKLWLPRIFGKVPVPCFDWRYTYSNVKSYHG